MAERMPWDAHRLPIAAQRKLAAAGVKLDDEEVASYVRNRNAYGEPEYNRGRAQVDAYLNDEAISLYAGADELSKTIRRGAYTAMEATRDTTVTHQEAVESLAALEGALSYLQYRVATLRAALSVRAEDDETDAALTRFTDALDGRATTTTTAREE